MSNGMLYKNGIIADRAAYDRIQKADTASILVFSDTHGTVEAIRWIFSAFNEQCAVCLFAGDGAEDILTIVQEAAVGTNTGLTYGQAVSVHKQASIPPVLIIAQGNCDRERYSITVSSADRKEYFNIPHYQRITIARQHIILTHGHLCQVDFDITRLRRIAVNSGCSIAVHGHTHIQSIDCAGSITVINGGSPLHPRGKSFGGFGILSIDNTNKKAEMAFYKLIRNNTGNFSASIHATYPITLNKPVANMPAL